MLLTTIHYPPLNPVGTASIVMLALVVLLAWLLTESSPAAEGFKRFVLWLSGPVSMVYAYVIGAQRFADASLLTSAIILIAFCVWLRLTGDAVRSPDRSAVWSCSFDVDRWCLDPRFFGQSVFHLL